MTDSGKELEKEIEKKTAKQADDYSFIREQIKVRPINRRKFIRRMAITAGSALLFGVIACAAFFLLEPIFNKNNNSANNAPLTRVELPEIEIPEDTLPVVEVSDEDSEDLHIISTAEENTQQIPPISEEETIIVETPIEELTEGSSESSTVVEVQEVVQELELSDYQLLYQKLSALSYEVGKSIVTVTYISDDTDWLNAENWADNHAKGIILGDNGRDMLILALQPGGIQKEEIRITFSDGSAVTASLQVIDKDTSLAVYAVPLNKISVTTKGEVVPITLGNSKTYTTLGSAVVAVGSPLGKESVAYGAITSMNGSIQYADASYQMLTTDIFGSVKAGGFLINTRGQLIGIITPSGHESGMEHLIYAYGISSVRKLMENLSNGTNTAYLGIVPGPIVEEAKEALGIPSGAFVKKTEMNSPAMAVGIAAGDIIVAIGESTITSQTEYLTTVEKLLPGEETTIKFLRYSNGDYRETTVTITVQGKYVAVD